MPPYKLIEIDKNFYSIEQDFVRCFLIVGERKVLLIDTGIGGELRAFVEQITSLPVEVLITHADGDHTGAAGQFDRRFMHPGEYDYYRFNNKARYAMEPVWEGDILDLGNYRFEIILIPGHTPGSIALLEREKRFLIGGDTLQTGKIFMFGRGRNFYAYMESIKKLQARKNEFDNIYASHDKLMVDADIIGRLYCAAGRIIRQEITGRQEEGFAEGIKCYETDGVRFLYQAE